MNDDGTVAETLDLVRCEPVEYTIDGGTKAARESMIDDIFFDGADISFAEEIISNIVKSADEVVRKNEEALRAAGFIGRKKK